MSSHAITITAQDQARIRADYFRQSWAWFGIWGLAFVGGLLGYSILLDDGAPGAPWILVLPGVALIAVLATLRGVTRGFRLSYPVGSEHGLTLTEATLEITGTAGASQIHWENIANLKRSRGAVYMSIMPTRLPVVLPARLVTDDIFAVMSERVGHPSRTIEPPAPTTAGE